jgi:chromosome segregation ATPase
MPTILNLNLNFELLLVAFALLMVLVVTTTGLAWHYVHAWRNTPLAADDAALETRIRQKQERLVDLDAGIVEREKNLHHRENADADVRYLESRRDEIKAEIAALEDGRVQLAEYEAELQELIEQLAYKSDELEEKRRACIEQETRAEATERRAETAENRIEGFRKVEAALRDEINQLEDQSEEARTLQRGLPELRDNVNALEAEKTRLEMIVGDLEQQVFAAQEDRAELEM